MSETAAPSLPVLLTMHPADVADILQRLSSEEAQSLLLALPPQTAALALSEMEYDSVSVLLEELPVAHFARLLLFVPPDSAADLLQHIPPAQRRETLAALSPEAASHVRSLLRYPEDCAGGIMSNRLIILREDMTIEQAREMLRDQVDTDKTQSIAYLYVVDHAKRLVGIVSLRDIAFRREGNRLVEIMQRNVSMLRVTDDQESIARQFEHYHYLGLPVVDEEGILVGVVKATDALEVAASEATEDMQLMVGLSGEERTLTAWTVSVRRRLPWLCVNLATAFLAAIVVGHYEQTIARWTALAVFLPIIAGQGGNSGMQTLTVIIRDLALGELSPGDGRRALIKELTLGLINGLVIGLLVGVVGWLWKDSPLLGVVAALAMLMNQLAAALAGVLIPLGLKACRLDPALASSIFLTTVTDVAGFFFFLGLATLALS